MAEEAQHRKCGDLFMEKIQKFVPIAFNEIENTWENIGLSSEERSRRTELLIEAAKEMFNKAVNRYDQEYNAIISDIEVIGKQVLVLENELKIKLKEPDEQLNTLQLKEFLGEYLEELQEEKQNRRNTYESLKEEEDKLESLLGYTQTTPSSDGVYVPNVKHLEDLRTHVAELRNEWDRRYCTFSALRGIVMRMWNSLELKPVTQFECEVAKADKTFHLTPEALDSLKSLKDRLEAESQRQISEAEHLRERIIMLWDLLHIPIREKELFLANNMGYTRSMIQALKEELAELEVNKTENMIVLISRLRDEILMFWDKCLYSKEQKDAFQPYFTDAVSEEILNQHEHYLKRLKDLYAECHGCFEKVTKLNELFLKLVTFVTKKDFNGDRFNNRGGALLKEEKERKKVQTLIPKLVAEIREAIDVWESTHDSRFVVFGKSFADYVDEKWEAYEKEKENERLERQLKKARNLEEGAGLSATMGSKRPYAHIGTPMSTRASKISRIITPMSSTSRMTPMTRVCTRSVLRAQNSCNTPLGKPPFSTSKTQPKRKVIPRRLHQKATPAVQRKLINLSRNQPTFNPFVARESENAALMPSDNTFNYSEFQGKLPTQADLCSTLLDPISGPSRVN